MIHVFIDTNVYLTFFSFTADDLEELRKLIAAVKNGNLKLWTTEQVRHELERNRENKVSESLAALRKMKPGEATPQMARNLPVFEELLESREEFGRRLNVLTEQLAEQFAARSLAADQVLAELMEAAEEIPTTNQTLAAARRRTEIGNPPGKKGSLGDAINWESLLGHGPAQQDLYLVTEDSDYVSTMTSDSISAFLAKEWRDAHDSEIHLHRRISSLLRDQFPDIKVATEFEKELRIRRLVDSPSFDRTHSAISQLASYTEFSEQQARDLLQGAVNNSQIRWISRDSDVQEFFRALLDQHRDHFTEEELVEFEERFGSR
jgi:predicted nucleic acid-binding protein